MVMTSSMASTLTTILPTARTTLSMAAFKCRSQDLREDPPQVPDPDLVDLGDGHAASVVFYVALTKASGNVLSDSIGSLGLMIAFYYGLTGFAASGSTGSVPLTFGQSVSLQDRSR